MTRTAVIVLCILALPLTGFGCWIAYDQHRIITTYVPVTARVIGTRVSEHHNSKGGPSYEPVVAYQYAINGSTYAGSRIYPFHRSGSRSWAAGVVAQFPSGAEVTAYRDPDSPGRAVLLREYSFVPYMLTLAGALLLVIALAGPGCFGSTTVRLPDPEPVTAGWYRLAIARRAGSRARAWLLLGGSWELAAAAALGPYFAAVRSADTGAIVATSIVGALGAAALIVAAYYALMGRAVADPEVLVDQPRLAPEQPVQVHVEQMLNRAIHIEQLRVGLICQETKKVRRGTKTTVTSKLIHQDWLPAAPAEDGAPGQTLRGTITFTPPADARSSSPDGSRAYPKYRWWIAVHTQVRGAPDYRAQFPIALDGLEPEPTGTGRTKVKVKWNVNVRRSDAADA